MIQASATRPTKVPIPDEVVTDFLDTVKATEAFSAPDIEWLESILTRPDETDGFHQLTKSFVFPRPDDGENLYAMCKAYNETKDKHTPTERFAAKNVLHQLLWSKRVSMYRQQRVLVAAPQRKQHPKYPTPNLDRFEGAGQHATCQLIALYGLDYVAARVQAAKQALADPNATHLMFVDDDVLMPRNALQVLFDTGLPIVAGIYTKKSPSLQTNATTSGEDPNLIYAQKLVQPEVGNMTPVPATCVGGGMLLIDLDVLRHMPEPWFEVLLGPDGKVVVGEDSLFVQKAAAYGFKTHVIPGLIGVHVDFFTGDHYGPKEIVDPVTRRIRPELVGDYMAFPKDLDLKELVAPDVTDYFQKNLRLKEMGAIK